MIAFLAYLFYINITIIRNLKFVLHICVLLSSFFGTLVSNLIIIPSLEALLWNIWVPTQVSKQEAFFY